MKIIMPSWNFEKEISYIDALHNIERIGRTCYKSEDKITQTSSEKFIRNIIKNGHESVLEHESISVRIICDRGVSHEIVRHRIASYSQESTRYCNYTNSKFGGEITFIKPIFWEDSSSEYNIWHKAMQESEEYYNSLIELGASPEKARSVLPNSLKTEIIVTMNLREWRHFFSLRAANAAHPQMREIAVPMLKTFYEKNPVFFQDIIVKLGL